MYADAGFFGVVLAGWRVKWQGHSEFLEDHSEFPGFPGLLYAGLRSVVGGSPDPACSQERSPQDTRCPGFCIKRRKSVAELGSVC